MRRTSLWLLALALVAGAAQAQLSTPDPDWKEAEVPAPPPLHTERLIRIEMPGSSLRFGVDPASIAIGSDRIVRYVVVATSSSGAVNAFYEGVRCNTAEVKVYAHYNPGSGWVRARESEWQAMHQTRNSRHSLVIARTGVCVGGAPNESPQKIARDLGADVDRRFRNN